MVGGDPLGTAELTQQDVDQWYESLKREPLNWVIELEGRCIGAARLHTVDLKNRRAKYAIGIFSPEHWGKGYGTEVTHLVLRYAFEQVGLHRVELRVLEYNKRAIGCYRRCGFVEEGRE